VARDFLPYDLDQHYLLPPDMREWLPAGHLVWFVSDVADALDLSQVMGAYEKRELRGRPGYHPAMMVKLLLYAYCVGKPSSRRVEKATFEEVPFRVLSADQHPDHASIAAFRRQHLPPLPASSCRCSRCVARRASRSSATWPSTAPSCAPVPRATRP